MKRALIIAAPMLLAGCISLAPDAEVPSVAAEIPASFTFDPADGDYAPVAWWTAFNDPVLNQLVDRALANNFDIAEAAARVEQSRAQARLARSALLPGVNATGGATSSSTPTAGSAFGGFGGVDRIENDSFTLGLAASYELDLFGRARNDLAAARQDALAVEQDYRSVQLATAAEVISAYFDVVDTRRQIALTEATSEVLLDRAARTNERYERGLVQSFELYQVRQDLRATQAALPQLRSALVANEGRLATLQGTYRENIAELLDGDLTPRLVFEPVPAGLPAELLEQRPDVAAAWARFEAARLRIGARRAERFPRLSLSASYGSQGGDVGGALNIVDNWAASLAANIVAPLIDGGRISANIRAARATYDQNAAAYSRAVVTAYSDVESALANYEQQRSRYLLITAQLRDAQASLDLQRRRYAAGVGGYTAYLDALRTVYQVESSLSSSARDTAIARLGVHRALGGDWAPDTIPTPIDMQPADTGLAGEDQ
ncbi:efflux transporter outer membrane subunit [Aurantiacibacter sp. D1-12]|uniref:efflux transporter outer membrane subunit n=1 Tax=Aurantiacibacter sp. D1-12 TaxID=2993658 RepID=UPI00237D1DBE|nr:TolC family protein [Aurantiacibacter sp. D1-12]MDE1467764.1 TolC family protein [Aurantiacibacter sp. D1-12]